MQIHLDPGKLDPQRKVTVQDGSLENEMVPIISPKGSIKLPRIGPTNTKGQYNIGGFIIARWDASLGCVVMDPEAIRRGFVHYEWACKYGWNLGGVKIEPDPAAWDRMKVLLAKLNTRGPGADNLPENFYLPIVYQRREANASGRETFDLTAALEQASSPADELDPRDEELEELRAKHEQAEADKKATKKATKKADKDGRAAVRNKD